MASLLSRLINTLRDIHIPFPMTQAPAAPELTAIADPATGTVDISGIIYQLESLHAAYDNVLKQAAEQLASLEIPETSMEDLRNSAVVAAQRYVRETVASGHLLDSQVRDLITFHVKETIQHDESHIKAVALGLIEERCDDAMEAKVKDLASALCVDMKNELRNCASDCASACKADFRILSERLQGDLRLLADSLNQTLESRWADRLKTVTAERDTLKASLMLLMGEEMRSLARETLAEAASNQPVL
jgi:hypothetical protein